MSVRVGLLISHQLECRPTNPIRCITLLTDSCLCPSIDFCRKTVRLSLYLLIYFPSMSAATGCDRANVRKRVAVQRMIYYLAKSEIKSRLRRRSCGICQCVGIH